MNKTKSIILAMAAAMALPSFAQSVPTTTERRSDKQGFYIQPVAGLLEFADQCDDPIEIPVSCEDAEIGYGIQGGYWLGEWMSVESGFLYGAGYDRDLRREITEVSDIEFYTISLGLRGRYMLGEHFFIDAKGGFHRWDYTANTMTTAAGVVSNTSIEQTGTNPYWGGGFGVAFGKSLSVVVEYTSYITDRESVDTKANFISMAAAYKF